MMRLQWLAFDRSMEDDVKSAKQDRKIIEKTRSYSNIKFKFDTSKVQSFDVGSVSNIGCVQSNLWKD